MSAWRWTFLDASGVSVTGPALTTAVFPTQSDAESWLGENWRTATADGARAVILHEDGAEVYGPMPLTR